MTLADALGTTTGGARSGLAMLAAMAIYAAFKTPRPNALIVRELMRMGLIVAVAAVIYSPVHAAALLGMRAPLPVVRLLDLGATLLGCAAMIHLLAVSALQRTVPQARVRRAVAANVSIIAMFVVAAWWVR